MPKSCTTIKHFGEMIIFVEYHFNVKLMTTFKKDNTEFHLNSLYWAICNIEVIDIQTKSYYSYCWSISMTLFDFQNIYITVSYVNKIKHLLRSLKGILRNSEIIIEIISKLNTLCVVTDVKRQKIKLQSSRTFTIAFIIYWLLLNNQF